MTSHEYKQRNYQALRRLLEWAGTPAELARIAGVNRSTVTRWFSTGKISRDAALMISDFPDCPLTKEQIRADIKVWN